MSSTDQEENKETNNADSSKRRSSGSCGRNSDGGRFSSGILKPSSLPTTKNLEEMKAEQLFLIEVLVQDVHVLKESNDLKDLKLKEDQELPPICVRVKFSDFPCIEICENDFTSPETNEYGNDDESKSVKSKAESDQPDVSSINAKERQLPSKTDISLGTGKSILFPMSPLQLLREIQKHPLMLNVYRQYSNSLHKYKVGQGMIRLGQEFQDIISKAVFEKMPLPVTTTIETDCKLINVFGDVTGIIKLTVRLSCFGATIVTQFQLLDEETDGYIFKTSKKDNTLEAQKKRRTILDCKGQLSGYAMPGLQSNTVETKHIHDISPLPPLIATEETAFPISGEISNPYLTAPYKVVPWRKYVKGCGCENSEDEPGIKPSNAFGSCGCGYNNKVAQNSLDPYMGADSICRNYRQSLPKGEQLTSNALNKENYCPLEDCDCCNDSAATATLSQNNDCCANCCPCSATNKIESKNCPATDCECFNTKQRNNFIRKKCPPVSGPYNSLYSPKLSLNNSRGSQVKGCTGQPLTSSMQRQSSLRRNCLNDFSNKIEATGVITTNSNAASNLTEKPNYSVIKNSCTRNQNKLDSVKNTLGKNIPNNCSCYCGGKPNTDVSGSQQIKSNFLQTGQDFKGLYETNSGSTPPAQVGSTFPQKLQTQEDDLKAFPRTEEIGGGDTNWQEFTTDQKGLPIEKGDEWSKQIKMDDKKMEEMSEAFREFEEELSPKKYSNQEEINGTGRKSSIIKQKQKKKKKINSIFHYSAGMYPGINIGHRHCTKEFRFVPKTMGWLWNLGDLGDNLRPRRGWKPGAITRTINKMIRQGKVAAGLLQEEENEEKEKKTAKGLKRSRRPFTPRSGAILSNQISGEYIAAPQPPTLHLHKKDGAYFISMNPLKIDSEDEDEDRTPLMFKILPHEDEVSTTSESSIEIEFTAPGAFRKKPFKPLMETVDTQYSDPDSLVEILLPPAVKGKKGPPSKKGTESNPPSTMASVAKDNKWDADQPTQIAKTKK